MSTPRFACSLRFANSWRATPEEINTLLEAMLDSFSDSGVEGLTIGGDVVVGSLDLSFVPPAEDKGLLPPLALVIKALNAGCVVAPGWPDNDDVAHAIASVTVEDFVLA